MTEMGRAPRELALVPSAENRQLMASHSPLAATQRLTRIAPQVMFWMAGLLYGVLACSNRAHVEREGPQSGSLAAGRASSHADADADAALTINYPAGRWRLTSLDELSRVNIWLSHILVRHSGVEPGTVSFHLPEWTPAAPAARTRQQAFREAQRIEHELATDPSRFASLAEMYSEDIATRDHGGSLGGINAAAISSYPEVLDAIQATRPGEVTRVVETPYGFHLFLRRSPPPEASVSGSRIVIAYDEAPWLRAFLSYRAIPARSRDEAMLLARAAFERARQGEEFERLVSEFSDHEDALRAGDFGVWSTRGASPFRREIELLQQLEVGEVAAPLDSPFGVQIIRRTANRSRQVFAMDVVQQTFDLNAQDGDPSSRSSVQRNMKSLAESLASGKSSFDALHQTYCCDARQQWEEGRGLARAERTLSKLEPNQVAAEPIELANAYAIVRRLEPRPAVPPPVRYELPAPARPDVEYLAREGILNIRLAAVGRRAKQVLNLDQELGAQLVALHEREGAEDAAHFEEGRLANYESFRQSVATLLGPGLYATYSDVLNSELEASLLMPRGERAPVSRADPAENTDARH